MTWIHLGLLSASFSRSSKRNLRNHNVNLKGACLPVTNGITKHWWWCRSSAGWCFFAVALSTLCWHTERLCVCFCTCVLQGPRSKSATGMTLPWSPALSGGTCRARCGQLPLLHVGCWGLGSPHFPWQWPCCDSRLLQFISEVVRGVQPQSYSWLLCLWPYRLLSLQFVLPGGQVLPRLLPKQLASAAARAARARGLVLCFTVRRTAATQGSCEPWRGGSEKAPVILPSQWLPCHDMNAQSRPPDTQPGQKPSDSPESFPG